MLSIDMTTFPLLQQYEEEVYQINLISVATMCAYDTFDVVSKSRNIISTSMIFAHGTYKKNSPRKLLRLLFISFQFICGALVAMLTEPLVYYK